MEEVCRELSRRQEAIGTWSSNTLSSTNESLRTAGPDRAGGGLAGKSRALPRVDPERREKGDLPENPDDEKEPLDPHRLVDRRLAEDGVDVDVGEVQARRHRGVEQERCAHEPCRRDDGERQNTNETPQAGSIPIVGSIESSSCSSRGLSRNSGPE